jgi:hypothetical protein
MKKYLLTSVVVLLAEAFAAGQSQDAGRLIMDLSRKKFDWMINRRLDSLDGILDDRLKFIHSNGWIQTKQEVIADLKSEKLVYQHIELREMEVRVFEKTAIVTGKGKFSGAVNAVPFSSDLLFTEVYVLNNEGWRLVSRHSNKQPQP